jgi:chloramphenicol 3-O phosphotransferase
MIIFLNGATSSGKSSIARAIQHLDDKPWLVLGIDTMINMMPSKYWVGGEKAEEGFNFISDKDEYGPLMSLKIGEFGHKISDALREMAYLLDKKGFHIIIDDVLLGDESLKKYIKKLEQSTVYFIGVHCDKKILEEREILRGDRFIGSGREQMNRCHGPNRKYDLEVNTTHHSPFDCAEQILELIKEENDPQGFKQLRELFHEPF